MNTSATGTPAPSQGTLAPGLPGGVAALIGLAALVVLWIAGTVAGRRDRREAARSCAPDDAPIPGSSGTGPGKLPGTVRGALAVTRAAASGRNGARCVPIAWQARSKRAQDGGQLRGAACPGELPRAGAGWRSGVRLVLRSARPRMVARRKSKSSSCPGDQPAGVPDRLLRCGRVSGRPPGRGWHVPAVIAVDHGDHPAGEVAEPVSELVVGAADEAADGGVSRPRSEAPRAAATSAPRRCLGGGEVGGPAAHRRTC